MASVQRSVSVADYRRLGLAPGAGAGDVKAKFRKLALRYHPDHNPGDAAATRNFLEIKAAYETISAAGFPGPFTVLTPMHTGVTAAPPAARRAAPVAPRRPASPPPLRVVGGMSMGETVWVLPESLLVAADRTCSIAPNASAIDRVDFNLHLRVESRADGFHVIIPFTTRYRWTVSRSAAHGGITVAAVEFDPVEARPNHRLRHLFTRHHRSDRRLIHLPPRLLRHTVAGMTIGDRAWVPLSAILVDRRDECWLDVRECANHEPTMTTPVRVERRAAGYAVTADIRPPKGSAKPTANHVQVSSRLGIPVTGSWASA